MLSKNHWVRPFFAFFMFVREILFVTVALDHPVVPLGPSITTRRRLSCSMPQMIVERRKILAEKQMIAEKMK